jgi:hypothetical protein
MQTTSHCIHFIQTKYSNKYQFVSMWFDPVVHDIPIAQNVVEEKTAPGGAI